ncbi:hypothetical protein [Terriglobus roseus]|uniref:Uncharacterized protein n=1 Tax=Terriglobus roseus TaxID=392734 RepID=A0A1H4S419_9BACT|nr:hypothetical protein [Terriglobus roseus]SEC38832.1 hypothetical protein SAMN05443244_3338 [Terriglobus roseus]
MPAHSAGVSEQTPAEVAHALEEFLADHSRAVLLDDGRVLFDMRESRYSISQEHGRCTLHLWSEDRNMVRRVSGFSTRKDTLKLQTLRFGQSKPQILELVAQPDRRTPTARDTTRRRYAATLERVLLRSYPDWKADDFRIAMDLEQSFGPAYARGVLQQGQKAWAVVGVNAEESQATIDGVLTVGLLWLGLCREQADGRRLLSGLRIVVPRGTASTTLARMAWLREDAARWELFELDQRTEELMERDAADTGNLITRLLHAPNTAAATERFSVPLLQAMAMVPIADQTRVEQRLRSSTELALLLHGLEFARIRQRVSANSFAQTSEISFGAGVQESPLDPGSEPMIREFVERLFARRRKGGSQKDPLYRMQPEAWLESELRANIGPLTDGQESLARFNTDYVYAQVPAFQASDRGMLDLLTVSHDGRLAVLELKAHEDMHFALQGLDYWLRVRWHHTQTIDASTGIGTFQRHGYFPGLRLSEDPPRLFLVAPSLRIHPATETVLRYLKPQVEWTLLGLNEKWRDGVKVITRKRSPGH